MLASKPALAEDEQQFPRWYWWFGLAFSLVLAPHHPLEFPQCVGAGPQPWDRICAAPSSSGDVSGCYPQQPGERDVCREKAGGLQYAPKVLKNNKIIKKEE